MNSRELLQAVSDFYEGKPPYKFGPHWTEELANERDDAWRELHERIQAYLSSSRVAAAPTSSPKGLERWKQILEEEIDRVCDLPDHFERAALSAIRRSVEEALGAEASPLEGEKT